eukprot:COSAG06_NODE_35818_length_455_cov_0.848315_1_plen_57_part_01
MIVFAFWSKEQTNYHPCISPDRVEREQLSDLGGRNRREGRCQRLRENVLFLISLYVC